MSDCFERAFTWTIEMEGGAVDDPDDDGGPTRWGISSRSYPNLNLETLTLEKAKAIYRADYWLKVRGDALEWPLNLVLFDWAVHSGPPTAIMTLQKVLGVKIDGKFGPDTKKSAAAAHQTALIRELIEERQESMILQAIAKPAKLKYLSNGKRVGAGGWVGRIVALSMECGASLTRSA